MDDKEKYRQALEKAKRLYEQGTITESLAYIFPELAESEDERIRKRLLTDFSVLGREEWGGLKVKDICAWLEKQDKQSNNEEAEKEKNDYVSSQFLYCKGSFNEFKEGESYWLEYIGNDNYIGRSDNILNQKFHITPRQLYTWLDPRHDYRHCENSNDGNTRMKGEQKPILDFKASDWYVSKVDGKIHNMYYVDKVKPKFKVGDWIAWEELNTAKIVNIDGDRYEVEFIDGNKGFPHIDYIDRLFHLWTIQDARDGDVLASDNSIFIFQEEYIAEKPIAYCGLMNGIFIKGEDACWTNEKCHPATNEQCETLFKAMHEAEYEWDTKKKELSHQETTEKCEQDKWSEEDDAMLNQTIEEVEYALNDKNLIYTGNEGVLIWLKSLKEKLGGK